MSKFYKPHRTRNLYDPVEYSSPDNPYKISRSKIENFIRCPYCFYMDRRRGVGHPPGYPFSLNSAVDTLLKKEFDQYRKLQKPHPLMTEYGIEAVPFQHSQIDIWRENFKGVQTLHKPTNLRITGAVDDVWVNPTGTLMVADYKATSKNEDITLDKKWQDGYKRQAEIYQWLLRQNNFTVSDTAYFVYANGDTTKKAFKNRLEFETKIIPYKGSDDWIETTLLEIKKVLDAPEPPKCRQECEFCMYRKAIKETSS